jgi:transposase
MAHAAKAKVMMGNVNKTDKLDAVGLATLERLGSLPTVWLPPGDLRDERDLPRTRMAISKIRTALKNRIHSTLAKYNLSLDTGSDIFAPKWRDQLLHALQALPPETMRCMEQELELLDFVQAHIHRLEKRIVERIELSETIRLVKSLPAVGIILSIVIEREIGSIDCFPACPNFTSYAGTTPKVKGSAGKYRYGRMRKQSNNYLNGPSSKLPMSWFVIATIPAGATSTSPDSMNVSADGRGISSPLVQQPDIYPMQPSGSSRRVNLARSLSPRWSRSDRGQRVANMYP